MSNTVELNCGLSLTVVYQKRVEMGVEEIALSSDLFRGWKLKLYYHPIKGAKYSFVKGNSTISADMSALNSFAPNWQEAIARSAYPISRQLANSISSGVHRRIKRERAKARKHRIKAALALAASKAKKEAEFQKRTEELAASKEARIAQFLQNHPVGTKWLGLIPCHPVTIQGAKLTPSGLCAITDQGYVPFRKFSCAIPKA